MLYIEQKNAVSKSYSGTLNSVEIEREKVIATHCRPDLDALLSGWLIKRGLPGWKDAYLAFTPVSTRWGTKLRLQKPLHYLTPEDSIEDTQVIEVLPKYEVIHVDNGYSPLDHHQPGVIDLDICAASLTWDYVRQNNISLPFSKEEQNAISRLVQHTVDVDHFQQVYWEDLKGKEQYFTAHLVLESLKSVITNDVVLAKITFQLIDGLVYSLSQGQQQNISIATKNIISQWIDKQPQTTAVSAIASYFENPRNDGHHAMGLMWMLDGLQQLQYPESYEEVVDIVLSGTAHFLEKDLLLAKEIVDIAEKDSNNIFATSQKRKGLVITGCISMSAELEAIKRGYDIVFFSEEGPTGHHAKISARPINKRRSKVDPYVNTRKRCD